MRGWRMSKAKYLLSMDCVPGTEVVFHLLLTETSDKLPWWYSHFAEEKMRLSQAKLFGG